jgi:hypothetical protein
MQSLSTIHLNKHTHHTHTHTRQAGAGIELALYGQRACCSAAAPRCSRARACTSTRLVHKSRGPGAARHTEPMSVALSLTSPSLFLSLSLCLVCCPSTTQYVVWYGVTARFGQTFCVIDRHTPFPGRIPMHHQAGELREQQRALKEGMRASKEQEALLQLQGKDLRHENRDLQECLAKLRTQVLGFRVRVSG